MSAHALSNHKIPAYPQQVLQFGWAVYSFGCGHFLSTISSRNLPFNVVLACDTYEFSCALFWEFTHCPCMFGSGSELLHHVQSSGDSLQICGYLIHSLRFKDSNTTSTFWQLQLTLIAQLRCLRNLQMLVVIIIPNQDGRCVKTFSRQLKSAGWCISKFDDVFFPDHSDNVVGHCDILIGVHSSCFSKVELLELKMSPPISPQPVGCFYGSHSTGWNISFFFPATTRTLFPRTYDSRPPILPWRFNRK
jgi:hypothetical protein